MARTDFDPFTRPPVGELKRYTGAEQSGSLDSAFNDLVDVINPLQQLPIISTLYREITGDAISGQARIVGGSLFGGPIGAAFALGNELIKQISGADLGEQAVKALLDRDPATAGQPGQGPIQVAGWQDLQSVERGTAGFAAFDPLGAARKSFDSNGTALALATAAPPTAPPSPATADVASDSDISSDARPQTVDIPLTGLAALAAFAADQQPRPLPAGPAAGAAAVTGASASRKPSESESASQAMLNALPFRPATGLPSRGPADPEVADPARDRPAALQSAATQAMVTSLLDAETAMQQQAQLQQTPTAGDANNLGVAATAPDGPDGQLTGTAALAAFAADLRQLGAQAQDLAPTDTEKPDAPADRPPNPQLAASYPPKSAFMPLEPKNWLARPPSTRSQAKIATSQQAVARKGAEAYSKAAARLTQTENLMGSDPVNSGGVASKMLDALVKYEAMTKQQAQQAEVF